MTTETTAPTMTENQELAQKVVNEKSPSQLVTYINELLDSKDGFRDSVRTSQNRKNEIIDIVTDFIKENYQDGANSEQIKSLAESLDIELTKRLNITFNVAVEYQVEVPLDMDEDEIDETMFDVEITNNFDGDAEITHEYNSIEDFNVEQD